MPTGSRHPLTALVRAAQLTDPSDDQLLGRFLAGRDEAAFAALVDRHGPMVLGVCRRVLGTEADDAFQATFIVLARKARALTRCPTLGGWLHETARRVALKARSSAARRRAREAAAARPELPPDVPRNDWLPLLDEELQRLPRKYLEPLVLCDLEGRTRADTARLLGWPEGTVAARVARGRALLGARLLRRAAAPALGLPALVSEPALAAVPGPLVEAAVCGALGAPAGLNPAAAVLARAVLRPKVFSRMAAAACVVLGVGFGAFALGGRGVPPADTAELVSSEPPLADRPSAPNAPSGKAGRAILSVRVRGLSVFASTSDGLYRGNHLGRSWSRLRGSGCPEPGGRFVSGSPEDPAVFYFVTRAAQREIAWWPSAVKPSPPVRPGLYRSRDGGGSWELMSDAHDFEQMVRVPGGRLFAVTWRDGRSAVLLSDNDGGAWRDVTNGISHGYPALLLSRDPDRPGQVALISPNTMRSGGTVLQAADDRYLWEPRLYSLQLEWPPDAQKTDREFFAPTRSYGYRLSWPAGTVQGLPDEFPSPAYAGSFGEQGQGFSTVGGWQATLDNYFSLPFGERTVMSQFEVVPAKAEYDFRRGQAMAVAVSLVNHADAATASFYPRVLDAADAKLFWTVQVSGFDGLRQRPGRRNQFEHMGNEELTLGSERKKRQVREHLLGPGKPLDRTLDLRDLGVPDKPGTYQVQVLYQCGPWRDEKKVVRTLDSVPGRVFTVRVQ